MLKDITNTYQNSKKEKPKSFSEEKIKPNQLTIEEEIQENYFLLSEQLMAPIDAQNAFITLKNLSILFSKGKINASSAQITLLLNMGLLELIITDIESYSSQDNGEELQNASLWFLANVLALVTEEQILSLIIKKPVIDVLISFLDSENPNNTEQSLWAIANLISYIEVRNIAIQKKLVENLLTLIAKMIQSISEKLFTLKINRTLTWLISNLCRKPSPPYAICINFLPYLATMVHFNDDQILRDACLALGNLALAESNTKEDDYSQIEEILSFNIGERCIELIQNPNKEVQMASLIFLGHLTYGNEKQTQRLIEGGILQGLKSVINMEEAFQRKKEALFALSNIAAGNSDQLERIIECGILSDVKKLITSTQKKQLIEESLFCFMNSTYNANSHQMEQIFDLKILEILLAQYKNRINQNENKLLEDLIEAIENIVLSIKNVPERVIKLLKVVGLNSTALKVQEKEEQTQNNQAN